MKLCVIFALISFYGIMPLEFAEILFKIQQFSNTSNISNVRGDKIALVGFVRSMPLALGILVWICFQFFSKYFSIVMAGKIM